MKLSHSYNLIRTPDFTQIPNIESLDLEGCISLLEVHESVGLLTKLVLLNLKDCKNLVSFPSSVCGLKSLKNLNLYGCSKLEKLPQNLGEVECLEELDLSGTAIRELPPSITLLTHLEKMSLRGCNGQQNRTWTSSIWSLLLPKRYQDSICLSLANLMGLKSLRTLDLSDCNLLEGAIPNDLCSLVSLETLDLSRNHFVSLPSRMNQLSKLKNLSLNNCQRLESLPELPFGIIFIGTQACVALKTFSSPLSPTSSANILFQFFNCSERVTDQGSATNITLAVMFLKLRLQELSSRSAQFHICLSSGEIPEWFSHRSHGASAAAYDLRIVATKNGAPVDIVKAFNNGLLIDPHDQKAIADALLKLVADKDMWSDCRKNGLKKIHHFSWTEHCRNYLSHVDHCRNRHPTTRLEIMKVPEEQMSDSLKDVEDLSLKVSIEGDFKLNGELDAATRQKKLIEAIIQKASFNGSASVTHSPGRRQTLFVIAADCYDSNGNITEKFQTTIKNVMKAAGLSIGLGKVGFILVTGSSLQETMEAIKSCPVNIEDFDAIICNSGSELYYPWRDNVADLDYEAHVEYKWPGENVRSMVIRLARTEAGDEDDDIAEYVDACSSRCYSYSIKPGAKVRFL
ncbi:disease resistance protein RPS4-like [Pistacia vera]|uniref:disease resistance protein RPS4-like n=1 Tax=Pistacia vera TaxID=55513 RepID=UPI001262BDE4|nr:disease resistance protein RPS4-like [Pistacia vera]